MSLIGWLFGADTAPPSDAMKLDGTSEAALGRSLSALPAGERGWITFAEARTSSAPRSRRAQARPGAAALVVTATNTTAAVTASLPRCAAFREQASPTKCAKNIVVASWAIDQIFASASASELRNTRSYEAGCTPGAATNSKAASHAEPAALPFPHTRHLRVQLKRASSGLSNRSGNSRSTALRPSNG